MAGRFNLKVHFPGWLTSRFPSAIWRMPTGNKTVYLTFDDGPIPEVTPSILEILEEHNIKATFFCVGENVSKYPAIYQQVIDAGHSVGNHTYNHIQGFKHNTESYIANVKKAEKLIDSDLFRPPHGSLKPRQYAKIIEQFKLIMWDVISCDYDQHLKPEQCFKHVKSFARDGSIITFHDSLKAEKNVIPALKMSIEYLSKEGFEFKPIVFSSHQPKPEKRAVRMAEMKANINKLLKGA